MIVELDWHESGIGGRPNISEEIYGAGDFYTPLKTSLSQLQLLLQLQLIGVVTQNWGLG